MKNRSNEIRSNVIRSNEIRFRRELPVVHMEKLFITIYLTNSRYVRWGVMATKKFDLNHVLLNYGQWIAILSKNDEAYFHFGVFQGKKCLP